MRDEDGATTQPSAPQCPHRPRVPVNASSGFSVRGAGGGGEGALRDRARRLCRNSAGQSLTEGSTRYAVAGSGARWPANVCPSKTPNFHASAHNHSALAACRAAGHYETDTTTRRSAGCPPRPQARPARPSRRIGFTTAPAILLRPRSRPAGGENLRRRKEDKKGGSVAAPRFVVGYPSSRLPTVTTEQRLDSVTELTSVSRRARPVGKPTEERWTA